MLVWFDGSPYGIVLEAGPRPPNLEEPDDVEVTTEKPLPGDAEKLFPADTAEKLFDDAEKPLEVEAEEDLWMLGGGLERSGCFMWEDKPEKTKISNHKEHSL